MDLIIDDKKSIECQKFLKNLLELNLEIPKSKFEEFIFEENLHFTLSGLYFSKKYKFKNEQLGRDLLFIGIFFNNFSDINKQLIKLAKKHNETSALYIGILYLNKGYGSGFFGSCNHSKIKGLKYLNQARLLNCKTASN